MKLKINLSNRLFMSLFFLLACSAEEKDVFVNKITSSSSTERITNYTYEKNNRRLSTKLTPKIYVHTTISVNNDTLFIEDYEQTFSETIPLSEPLSAASHHVFGNLKAGILYSTAINYSDTLEDYLYKINLKNGHVDKYFLEVDFTNYGERFGRSLIDQFARNDTFFLGFTYPYISPFINTGPDIWDVPHLGMAFLDKDSVKFIKAFGFQRPRLYKDCIWKHPKVFYIPENNEILFSYYWSDVILVYDFKGNLKSKIHTKIDGYSQNKFLGTNLKPDCFGSGTWDGYLRDSTLCFNLIGYSHTFDLYYRTVRFPVNDSRKQSAIIFFDAHGNIHHEIDGFENEYGLIELKDSVLISFHSAYDSLNFRVINFNIHNYPLALLAE